MQQLDRGAEDCRTLFGWNHYPDPLKQGLRADQLRLLPHADTDIITLLFQRPGEPVAPELCGDEPRAIVPQTSLHVHQSGGQAVAVGDTVWGGVPWNADHT